MSLWDGVWKWRLIKCCEDCSMLFNRQATEKALEPIRILVRDMSYSPSVAERRWARPSSTDTQWRIYYWAMAPPPLWEFTFRFFCYIAKPWSTHIWVIWYFKLAPWIWSQQAYTFSYLLSCARTMTDNHANVRGWRWSWIHPLATAVGKLPVKDFRIGVKWWNLGVLVTARAAEFRTSWRPFVCLPGRLSTKGLGLQ